MREGGGGGTKGWRKIWREKKGGGGRRRDEGMEGDMEVEEGSGGVREVASELLIPGWMKCT